MELFNPKPIGTFIEYTLKPLIEESRNLIDIIDEHHIKLGDILRYAYRIYIIDNIIRLVTSLSVTGLICYTVYLVLLNSQTIRP